MDPVLVDELRDAGYKIALNTALIHLICRLASFARAKPVYDETPYWMKLQAMAQAVRGGSQEAATTAEDEEEESEEASESDAQQKNKKKKRARSKSPGAALKRSADSKGSSQASDSSEPDKYDKPLVIVTGSSGRVGSATVRALVETGKFYVRGLDRHEPTPVRKCEGVDYRMIDIAESPEAEVLALLEGAVGIIHCAGTIALYNAPVLVHNGITFATVRLMCLARMAGVTAFVHTGSTMVINNGKLNLNAIPADSPYEMDQTNPWGRAHIKTEQYVLQASDDPTSDHGTFFTCVNRFPGTYGLHDQLIVSILIENELSVFPSRTDVRVELLYLKNAAHAHVCALRALLDSSSRVNAAGRAQIITQSVEGETTTNIEFWTRGRRAMGIKRDFVILPGWIFYLFAVFLNFLYFYFCGIVPKSVLWNYTSGFVNSILHDNTFLGQKESLRAIGYKPKYTNESSFEDMARELREAAKKHPNSSAVLSTRQILYQLDHDPKEDIDWEPRVMPKKPSFLRSLFLTLLGPGITWHEIMIFALSMVSSYVFAFSVSSRYAFTIPQTIMTCIMASWHITGAIMSIGPTNKRWFHLGGKLGMFMLLLMVCDCTVSVLISGVAFSPTPDPAVAWIAVSGAILLLGLFIIIFLVPLTYQRMYAVICFFAVLLAHWHGLIPVLRPGMEWLLPLMAFKFFIAHGPRHEPYRYDA